MKLINIGTAPNSGNGDTLRDAMSIINSNFSEISKSFGLDIPEIPSNIKLSTALTLINSNFMLIEESRIKIERKLKLQKINVL